MMRCMYAISGVVIACSLIDNIMHKRRSNVGTELSNTPTDLINLSVVCGQEY